MLTNRPEILASLGGRVPPCHSPARLVSGIDHYLMHGRLTPNCVARTAFIFSGSAVKIKLRTHVRGRPSLSHCMPAGYWRHTAGLQDLIPPCSMRSGMPTKTANSRNRDLCVRGRPSIYGKPDRDLRRNVLVVGAATITGRESPTKR